MKGHFEAPQIRSVHDAARRWVRDHGHVVAPPRGVYGYGTDPDTAGPDDLVSDVAVPFG